MCLCEAIGVVSSMLRLVRRVVSLTRMLSTLDLIWEKKGTLGNGTRPGYVVCIQLLKLQKSGWFPMSLQIENSHKITVKSVRGGNNRSHERN